MNTILGFGAEDTGWRRHQKIAEMEDGLWYGPQDWNRRDKKNIRISVGETAARIYK